MRSVQSVMIIDCYHNDLTAIINARLQARHDRKRRNRLRYERQYDRVLRRIDSILAECCDEALRTTARVRRSIGEIP
jgi:hypothetical protein